MKKFAIKSFILLLLPLFLITSCDGDDDSVSCEADSLSEIIVGTWEADYDPNTVTFNADGTLDDPNEVVIGGEVNGIVFTEKTYEVISDTELYVRAQEPNNPTNNVDATLDVTSFDCDEFSIELFGITGTFTKQ